MVEQTTRSFGTMIDSKGAAAMEWMKIIGNAIPYIERHITDELSVQAIAAAVNVSPFYFQKGVCHALRLRRL